MEAGSLGAFRINLGFTAEDGRRLEAERRRSGVPTREFVRRLIRRELDRLDDSARRKPRAG